jgi:hypothetical protein
VIITDAWLGAVRQLRVANREQFDLIVDVDDPTPRLADHGVIAALDDLLIRLSLQPVRTVANTIFPARLARTSRTPAILAQRYLDIYPRIRRERANSRGTYFGRVVSYSLREEGGTSVNQLGTLIEDLRTELGHRANGQGCKRHLYEVQIFAPGRDRRPLGFPCMSSMSFHIDEGRLRLTATYRNQYYVARALGNFFGLSELQAYVAGQVGLRQGPLAVHAFHAEIEPGIALADVDTLLQRCSGLAVPGNAESRSR